MSQLFSNVKVASTKRSTFDLSHHQVTTSDFGYLIPICYRDMVPNDDFVVKPNIFCRLAPLAVPTYGKITCRVHHFFVPYRILYPKWDAFITKDPNNFTVPPYLTSSVLQQALRADSQLDPSIQIGERGKWCRVMSNLGLNPHLLYSGAIGNSERFSMFPFLAYYRIWMDYFMDSSINNHENMVQQFNTWIANGGNLYSVSTAVTRILEARSCCFKKDYFTTAKLNPQDGSNPSMVGVDLGTDFNSALVPIPGQTGAGNIQSYNDGRVLNSLSSSAAGGNSKIGQFTIEALRAANSLQRYLERNNYVGTKIINRILAHFGVAPTPERLDMAEFIGGSSFPIQIADVTSHTPTIDPSLSISNDGYSTAGLGMQSGKGVGAGSDVVRYHAKEHGVFMSIMSILPDTGYYQGVSRFWQKGVYGDALDYYTPEFENLGYQELLNKEVYVPSIYEITDYTQYNPDSIFGYTPRYSEYKFQNDVLAGDFITNSQDREQSFGAIPDAFHLFRHLSYDDTMPLALNENFVQCNNQNNSYDRIFQFMTNKFDHFYFNIDVDVKATRPMTGFAEPSLDSTNEGDGNSVDLPYGGTRL